MTSTLHRSALRLLVSTVALIALGVWVYALRQLTDYSTAVQLCVVVLAASTLRFPHGPARGATLASIVTMSVYVIAGPAAAVVVAGVGALMQPRDVPLIKRVHNTSQRILSAGGGAVAYILLNAPTGDDAFIHAPQAILGVTAAGVVHQLVNAVLMCMVLSLERGVTVVISFFREVVAPTALPMLGYGLLGVLMAVVWLGGLGILAGLLVMVPLIVARWALTQDEAERAAQAAAMRAFIEVIETKDLYTRGHSERVSRGVGMLGRRLQLPADRQQALEHAGLLHDVGKVGVPTSIIRKPGRLDDTEMDAIRLHPARGVELIGNIPFLEEVKSAVLHHHEKYDGSGYPAGLSGTKIPYFARIIGIVDAFDSLTSTRSYRPARSVEQTLAILEQDRLTHFDPALVDAFVHVIRTQGWLAAAEEQPAPDSNVDVTIDHDDLSLGSGGGASGTAAGPT
ncbi:HD-GYP domain-containing protein [Kribbella sp.]|uniref:HD-GYP domain-containing protein n=1 Tax=Kribbella sp. TaxID=1871183 RepID=UPI002D3222C4|nr:HD-GYP domain-containing protein [Kribbella sp.]HZX03936.1 HD-GYP domain-containing protein [Kribbella sp.]